MLGDALPVLDARATQGIDAQGQACFLDGGHIDNIRQPFNKRLHQIFSGDVAARPRLVQRNAFHRRQAFRQ